MAWDWWNANNVYGVDFKAGINTQTYKYYIDFAAKYGIPYIILDEGWKVSEAKIADYVVVARRNGREWYIGAMTDWTPRELDVDLSFLLDGNFHMAAYEDGANADRMASDYKLVRSQ